MKYLILDWYPHWEKQREGCHWDTEQNLNTYPPDYIVIVSDV